MSRSLILIFSFTALLCSQLSASEKPNILWVIAEDMSPDLGCYGNKLVHTPNIDNLAAKGMRFDQVHVTGPACSPSRTALATGVFQTSLGAHHMRYPEALKPSLPVGIKTLPQLMTEQGYVCGNLRSFYGTGKDDWLFEAKNHWHVNKWDSLIADGRPFFAQINFSVTHRKFKKKAKVTIDQAAIQLPPYYPNHRVAREDWAGYLTDVNRTDELLGSILEKLRESGLADNTIIFFFSDHGRPMTRGKNWLYDSGTRIPLIVYIPEKLKPEHYTAGQSTKQLVSSVDLVDQTLKFSGLELPSWMQGRPLLLPAEKQRTVVFNAIDRVGNIESGSRAIRTQRYKYIRNFKQPGSINSSATAYRQANHPIHHLLNSLAEKNLLSKEQQQLMLPLAVEELYDLEKDPFETKNLIGDKEYAQIHQALARQLKNWLVESKDQGLKDDSKLIVEAFAKYGDETQQRSGKAIKALKNKVEKQIKMETGK